MARRAERPQGRCVHGSRQVRPTSMLDYLKALYGRLVIHWHVVLAAIIAAAPSILDYLGLIDLTPLLTHAGLSEGLAKFIVGALPFVLAFIRPMLAMTPK